MSSTTHPFVAIFVAVGWTIVWKSRRLHFLGYVLPVFLALVIWRPLRDYSDHSKQSLSDAVSLARQGNAVVAEFWSDAGFYDRGIHRIHSVDDLLNIWREIWLQKFKMHKVTAGLSNDTLFVTRI